MTKFKMKVAAVTAYGTLGGEIYDSNNFPPGFYEGLKAGGLAIPYIDDEDIINSDASINSLLTDVAAQVGVVSENKYNYAYNANGDIQTVTEKTKNDVLISTTTYNYKADGNVDTSVKVSGNVTITTQYIYDANGNLTDTTNIKS